MLRRTLARVVQIVPMLFLAFLFAWAAWERFRLPMTPCADSDVWVYLRPGLAGLMGEGFGHVYGQCFLYPWFLYAILRLGGDFRWITVTQHLLGLGTGALLLGCWMQLRALLPTSRKPVPGVKVLGILLAGIYLLASQTIAFERALRPEAIFPFVVVLQIFCNLGFIRARFHDHRSSRAAVNGGLAVFFSVAAFLLKPSFFAAMLLANLPIICSLFRRGQSLKGKLTLAGMPVLLAGTLLIWPEWKLRQQDTTGPLFVGQSLFSIHANLINKQMSEDLARGVDTKYPRVFVSAAHAALTESLRESRAKGVGEHWPALGFNPDYMTYGDAGHPSFAAWVSRQIREKEAQTAFYRYYYQRILRQHPDWIAAKVWRQLHTFYHFGGCPAFALYHDDDLGAEYRQSFAAITDGYPLSRYPPGVDLMARTNALRASNLWINRPSVVTKVGSLLAATYLWWCVSALLLTLAAWKIPLLRSQLGGVASVILLLYAYNFGTVLTLGFSHTLDVGRYSQYQLAYTLLSEFASIWLATEAFALIFGQKEGWLRRTWRELLARWSKSEGGVRASSSSLAPIPPDKPLVISTVLFEGRHPRLADRSAFPNLHLLSNTNYSTGNAPTTLPEIDVDFILMIDEEARYSSAVARRCLHVCATAPEDLLIARLEHRRSVVEFLSASILWYVFGWSARCPLPTAWICSRRLYHHLRFSSVADVGQMGLEATIQALDRGYSIREIPLAVSPSPNTPLPGKGPPDLLHFGARPLWALISWSIRRRTLVSMLGLIGMVFCVVGLALGNYSWQQAHKRGHHFKYFKVLESPALVGAGLLSLQAGLLLGGRPLRRSRE